MLLCVGHDSAIFCSLTLLGRISVLLTTKDNRNFIMIVRHFPPALHCARAGSGVFVCVFKCVSGAVEAELHFNILPTNKTVSPIRHTISQPQDTTLLYRTPPLDPPAPSTSQAIIRIFHSPFAQPSSTINYLPQKVMSFGHTMRNRVSTYTSHQM